MNGRLSSRLPDKIVLHDGTVVPISRQEVA